MNNALDPIKIIFCGGHGVGKTSLLKRLAGMPFPYNYDRTTGVNEFNFRVPLISGVEVSVVLVDIGAAVLQNQRHNNAAFTALTMNVDAAVLVVDSVSAQSMKESDLWLDFLTVYVGNHDPKNAVNKYLLVHKADLPLERRVITPHSLDEFVRMVRMGGWAYTVAHADLCDIDTARGAVHRQKAPQDVLRQLVTTVLLKRQQNLYKLLPVVMELKFVDWTQYDAADLDKYAQAQNYS